MRRFEGKNVVISGSSRGIGLAILEAFAKDGANIAACSNRKSETVIENYKKISSQYGVEIYPFFFDMSDEKAAKECANSLKEKMPQVDVLVNNAGISHIAPFMLTKS